MDKWIGGEQGLEAELAAQEQREIIRSETGQDVITNHHS
jgi:hypothetical protein